MDNRFFKGNRKREAPVDDIEDERVFKLRKKMVGIGLGELYDLGVIPIKLKVKKESTEPQPAPSRDCCSQACVQPDPYSRSHAYCPASFNMLGILWTRSIDWSKARVRSSIDIHNTDGPGNRTFEEDGPYLLAVPALSRLLQYNTER
ncbi:hypothetical protein EV424DRAFT_1554636 [Suillus variegatus]|nr:hypothetical protein EV424DRAFT_1554636 [Suillus variegatus]